ncbi:unnamed protein product [Soboliphyme baturini]|uniref:Endo/exonuclease/phosphatase domain-containing protein n=1 Tax=Soboliphyme baturini TaxID=241478 RepID=A0A183IUX3_9BILA|nr:unnamed protein product [Soboliphyme baturini]
MGDFNVHVKVDAEKWNSVIGIKSSSHLNNNGISSVEECISIRDAECLTFALKKAQSYQPSITLLLMCCAVRNGIPRAKFANNAARLFEQIPVMTNDTKTEWQLFKSGILEDAADCCGCKLVGLPPRGQKRSSWWAREVQLAVKEKNEAFKKWLGNKEHSTRVR